MVHDNNRGMDNPIEEPSGQYGRSFEGIEAPSAPQHGDVVADEEIEEVPGSIFGGFQIVRSEFFSQLREPAITFNQGKVGVNTACIRKLPNVDYAQILVNRERKMLAIRPCQETDIFSFQWCAYRAKDHKREPRQVTGKMFFLKICKLMGWNLNHRYKILGKLVRANNEYLFVFNLNSAQTFIREPAADGKKAKVSRTAIFPAEWRNQFGIPFEDHQKALQINVFEGYAVYSIKDEIVDSPAPPNSQTPPPRPDDTKGGEHPW